MKPSLLKRSQTAIVFENIVDKAFNILGAQFDLEIKYVEKYNLDQERMYKLSVVETNLLSYPVNFYGVFKGLLELHFSSPLNVKQIHRVDSILSLFVKSPTQYLERTVLLKELENYLIAQKNTDSSKVVNIKDFKKSKINDSQITDLSYLKIIKSHPPIFIEGSNVDDRAKLALELHYFLRYKSFVNFTDISQNITSYKDLLELNTSTIYINDADKLSFEHKMIFLDYFTEPNIKDHPLIISSSDTSYAFLLRDTLNRTLLKFLSIYHIRLNKPLSEIKKDGFTTFLNSILKDPKHFFTTH